MDAMYFFGFRLDFIKNFYETSSQPFLKIKSDIENGVEPYEPPYAEDDEPCFELEWNQADTSLVVLGGSCISMLGGALHLLLDSLMHLHGDVDEFVATKSKDGWWGKHQSYFHARGVDFSSSGVDMTLLSEIVLARNRVQHPEGLTTGNAKYQQEDLDKVSNPFFVKATEVELFQSLNGEGHLPLFMPEIFVDLEKLVAAIEEVRKFGRWFTQKLGYAPRDW